MRLKIDESWLKKEIRSAYKIRQDYETWQEQALRMVKEVTDLRQLRELFYKLGDRWEWQQATGTWLSKSRPLDAVGLILRAPGLSQGRERYIVYIIMAYSKGAVAKFDHLGDKERIIIERDVTTDDLRAWSTCGHGALDLIARDLTPLNSVEQVLRKGYLIAQPGDHALRLEVPVLDRLRTELEHLLWRIAMGGRTFSIQEIETLTAREVEDVLGVRFYEYVEAVVTLERLWSRIKSDTAGSIKARAAGRISESDKPSIMRTLRMIEGLLYILWFRPPALQITPLRRAYRILSAEPTQNHIHNEILTQLQRVIRSLNDVLERTKYLKWKSVIERDSLSTGELFENLSVSLFAKEALSTAFEDIMREHTLAYIGYPERVTARGKLMRIVFGLGVLPLRIMIRCLEDVLSYILRLSPSRQIKRRRTQTTLGLDNG